MLHNKVDQRHVKVHRMEHKSFMYDVHNMLTHSSRQEDLFEMIEKLVRFITSWLTYHILSTDRIMAAQIASIQDGTSPEKAMNFGIRLNTMRQFHINVKFCI